MNGQQLTHARLLLEYFSLWLIKMKGIVTRKIKQYIFNPGLFIQLPYRLFY